MRLASDILYRFARATGDARLDGLEAELEIPNTLVPIFSPVGPLSNIAGFLAADNQRESFVAGLSQGQAASTAVVLGTVCVFGRGLWEIIVTMTYLSNFTQASTAGSVRSADLRLVDPIADVGILLGMFAVNAVPQFQRSNLRLVFAVDGWSIQLRNVATGVGETQIAVAQVQAVRLD